jgi:hypothetical protein
LTPVTQYLADAPVNTLTGSAVLSNKNTATHGRAAGYVGNGGSITFNKVHVDQAGVYNIGILFFNGEVSRPGTISVNNGTPMNVTFPGTGSFSTLGTVTQSLSLIAGDNSIAISAPGNSYAPDLDSIVVPSQTTRYLADGAQLKGSNIKIINAVNCTDGHCVSEIGKTNTLIFDKVTVAAAGVHHVTILYLTDVDRSAELTVNWSTPIKVEFPSTSGVANNNNVVGAVSVDLPLRQGTNNITVFNPKTWAPDLDSIIVAQ